MDGGGRGQLLHEPNARYEYDLDDVTAEDLHDFIIEDGLLPTDLDNADPAQNHVVAVVYGDGDDYHYYRWDIDGTWSHKPAKGLPRNTDRSGSVIESPETCTRPRYKTFIGYFEVPKNGIVFAPDKSIREADLPDIAPEFG